MASRAGITERAAEGGDTCVDSFIQPDSGLRPRAQPGERATVGDFCSGPRGPQHTACLRRRLLLLGMSFSLGSGVLLLCLSVCLHQNAGHTVDWCPLHAGGAHPSSEGAGPGAGWCLAQRLPGMGAEDTGQR